MSFIKHDFNEIPFSSETPHDDFYTYGNVEDLAAKCEMYKEDNVRCRTIGVLQSEHGKFFISDINSSGVLNCKIQASMVYLKTPLQSTTIPYPVQVFGMLQWKNRPVIFINLLQVLSVPMALRIKEIMSSIVATHLAANHRNLE